MLSRYSSNIGNKVTAFMSVLMMLLLLFNISFVGLFKLYFEANRDSITAAYCVNKAAPEKKCNGTCYMNKQLKKATSTQQNAVSKINLDFQYISGTCIQVDLIDWETTHVKKHIVYSFDFPQSIYFEVFSPPRV